MSSGDYELLRGSRNGSGASYYASSVFWGRIASILLLSFQVQNPPRGRDVRNNLLSNQGFLIHHYAGEVTYTTSGWLNKNTSRLDPDVEEVLRRSNCDLVRMFAESEPQTQVCRTIKNLDTVAGSYMTNLQALVERLQLSSLQYVRCFKPNRVQRADLFDPKWAGTSRGHFIETIIGRHVWTGGGGIRR